MMVTTRLGVYRAQVRVFEEPDQVRFAGFLERQDGRGLETEVRYLELPRNLLHQSLKG